MTINFFEPGDVPKPPDQIRIEKLEADVYEDRWRVKVTIHITPFLERPSLAMAMVKDERQLVGEMNIIETMHNKMEFTMHLRGVEDPAGDYMLKVRLYYSKNLAQADGEEALQPIMIEQQEIPVSVPAYEEEA